MYAHAMDGSGYADEVRSAVEAAVNKVHSNPAHD
jgi:hypothetical protein